MIIVTVHHWCKPGMVEQARERIDSNGDEMAKWKGFLFRHRIEKADEPQRVSTVSGWSDEPSYRAYQSAKKAKDAAANAVSPYERVQNEVFAVQHSHSSAA